MDTLSTTCALVTIRSSVSFLPTIIPVPLVEASYCCCPQPYIEDELLTVVVPLRATIAGSAACATLSTFIDEYCERLVSPLALISSLVTLSILLVTVEIV